MLPEFDLHYLERGVGDNIPREKINHFDLQRGRIISVAIRLEDLIREIVAMVFTLENKNREVMENFIRDEILVMREISFNTLAKMLKKIITKLKDSSFSERFIQVFNKFIKYRNIFAHGEFVYNEDKVFIKYVDSSKDDKITEVEVTQEFLTEVQESFMKTQDVLQELVNT